MGHPRALWERGQGWAGSPDCECLQKPGGLQTPAGASQAADPGPAGHLTPAVPPLLAPHSWGAAALDAASLTDGHLPWQGSVHTALQLLAGGPTGEICLPRVGQCMQSCGQWLCQAPCPESEPQASAG